MIRLWTVAAIALLLSACGSGTTPGSAQSPKTGGSLRVAQETEIVTLDPAQSRLIVEREVYYNLYDSLIGIDAKLDFVPALATAWRYPDLQTLVLTLRQGVKFQDGTEFDAEAAKFNLDRYITDPSSNRKSELASVASVEAQDEYTVVLHLSRPDGTLLAQLVDRAGMMLSPAAVRKAGGNLSVEPAGAGSGPFEFVEWKRDDHLTLKRNPGYWRKDRAGRRLPYLDGVTFHPRPDYSAIVAGLKSGDFDFARTVNSKDVAAIRADPGLVYRDVPGLGFHGMWLNSSAAPFDDPKKARAVAMAIDRAEILKDVVFGMGTISHGPITPVSWAYDPSEKIYDRPDVEGARATATGFSFTLRLAANQEDMEVGELLRAQLAKAGINVDLVTEDFGKLVTEASQHQFQAALLSWSGRIDPDGNTYTVFHTGGGINYGLYSNPEVDQLLEHARFSTDQAKRKQLYQEAQRIIVRDAAYVFTYDPAVPEIASVKVRNFTLVPDGINRFGEVWLA